MWAAMWVTGPDTRATPCGIRPRSPAPTASAASWRVCRRATTMSCRRKSCSASRPTSAFPISSTPARSWRRCRGPAAISSSNWIMSERFAGAPATCFEPWMIYATGGFAFAGSRILNPLPTGDAEKALRVRPGWVAGAGAEYAFAPHWTVRFEYLYSQFGSARGAVPVGHALCGDHGFARVAPRPQSQARLARREWRRAGRPARRHGARRTGRCTARPPTSSRAIRRFARPMSAPTA